VARALQHQAHQPEQRTEQADARGEHGRGQPRHEADLEEGDDHRGADGERREREQRAERAEEAARTVETQEPHDLPEDVRTVAVRAQLAVGPLAAGSVARVDLGHGHTHVQRVDGHLGLDLEALTHRGKRLHEAAGQHAIAGEDVARAGSEGAEHERVEQAVAEHVAGAIGARVGMAAQARDHVEALGPQTLDHALRPVGVVGAVAIGQHVHVGVDLSEGAAHGVALAATELAEHTCARAGSGLRGVVHRGVVDDDDVRAGERAPERGHRVGHGELLVVARQDHGDTRHPG
jgi:hypothetical protein